MLESLESQFGITQSMLQFLILAGVGALILGTYWRPIAGGLGVLFVIYVFVHDPNGRTDSSTSMSPQPISEPQAIASSTLQSNTPESVRIHDEFMADCTTIAANEKEQCEEIWRETEPPESGQE